MWIYGYCSKDKDFLTRIGIFGTKTAPMHPKFILFSRPEAPLTGTFIYGEVFQHKDLVPGYGKVHGGAGTGKTTHSGR